MSPASSNNSQTELLHDAPLPISNVQSTAAHGSLKRYLSNYQGVCTWIWHTVLYIKLILSVEISYTCVTLALMGEVTTVIVRSCVYNKHLTSFQLYHDDLHLFHMSEANNALCVLILFMYLIFVWYASRQHIISRTRKLACSVITTLLLIAEVVISVFVFLHIRSSNRSYTETFAGQVIEGFVLALWLLLSWVPYWVWQIASLARGRPSRSRSVSNAPSLRNQPSGSRNRSGALLVASNRASSDGRTSTSSLSSQLRRSNRSRSPSVAASIRSRRHRASQVTVSPSAIVTNKQHGSVPELRGVSLSRPSSPRHNVPLMLHNAAHLLQSIFYTLAEALFDHNLERVVRGGKDQLDLELILKADDKFDAIRTRRPLVQEDLLCDVVPNLSLEERKNVLGFGNCESAIVLLTDLLAHFLPGALPPVEFFAEFPHPLMFKSRTELR